MSRKRSGNIVYVPNEYIYVLIDPRDDKPRYVGRTQYPDRRYEQHLMRTSGPTKAWVAELKQAGIVPKMVVLQEIVQFHACSAEQKTIERYIAEGASLLNKNHTQRSARNKNIVNPDGSQFVKPDPFKKKEAC